MNSSPDPDARPILAIGRYALFGELATGGMATVHFGRMSSLGGFNRTVAIKRMRRDIAMDPEFVAMFLDEARLASRIEHPNVVSVLDVVADEGEVFLVMEYVRGESLQRLCRASRARKTPVPVPIAVSIMSGALSGLHAAHEALGEDGVPLEIIHRDVTPQNILVGEDGIARISDFGIAKAESRLQVTQDGQMKGKLPYMAPEQLSGTRKRIDRRVDLFSSAVVLWETLTGESLFRADHPGETMGRILSGPIPSLPSIREDVPPALDREIQRALSREPEQRPPTAAAFALALEEAMGGSLASQRVVGAWVSKLAGEILSNRMKYVREMESTASMAIPRIPLRAQKPEEPPPPAPQPPEPNPNGEHQVGPSLMPTKLEPIPAVVETMADLEPTLSPAQGKQIRAAISTQPDLIDTIEGEIADFDDLPKVGSIPEAPRILPPTALAVVPAPGAQDAVETSRTVKRRRSPWTLLAAGILLLPAALLIIHLVAPIPMVSELGVVPTLGAASAQGRVTASTFAASLGAPDSSQSVVAPSSAVPPTSASASASSSSSAGGKPTSGKGAPTGAYIPDLP